MCVEHPCPLTGEWTCTYNGASPSLSLRKRKGRLGPNMDEPEDVCSVK